MGARGLSQKSIDCLRIAEAYDQPETIWNIAYVTACQLYTEKVVLTKMEKLADRGYIEYGVSARTGWLTDKGRSALNGG